MRALSVLVLTLILVPSLQAGDTPLVEQYLHAGEYAKGEQALTLELAAKPKDDQIRFGLGVLQVFHGVERMGQSLYEYGVKSESQHLPFVRLPVPRNPNPSPITYTAFRRILEAMHRDLEHAERTLAGITDDTVTLPLRLAPIRFDFKGDGHAHDTFVSVIKSMMRTDLQFLKSNSDFLVRFDRGDVAWLRSYCHLLMGILDLYLAVDGEDSFDRYGDQMFAQPKRRSTEPLPDKMPNVIAVKEPARFGQLRLHLLAVCQLNRETWRHIRAETDDDHEWLPHAKQKGVIGLPVNDAQINAWLAMMQEFEGLLEGKKVIPQALLRFAWPEINGGLNVRTLLEDPPAKFDWDIVIKRGPLPKYLDAKGGDFDVNNILAVVRLFDNPLGLGYMTWFN